MPVGGLTATIVFGTSSLPCTRRTGSSDPTHSSREPASGRSGRLARTTAGSQGGWEGTHLRDVGFGSFVPYGTAGSIVTNGCLSPRQPFVFSSRGTLLCRSGPRGFPGPRPASPRTAAPGNRHWDGGAGVDPLSWTLHQNLDRTTLLDTCEESTATRVPDS